MPVIRPHVAPVSLERGPARGVLAASLLLLHELPELLTGSVGVTSGDSEPTLVRDGEHPSVSSIEQIQGSIKGKKREAFRERSHMHSDESFNKHFLLPTL